MKKVFIFLWNNLIVRTVCLIAILSAFGLYGVMSWIDSYTLHNQAILVPNLEALQLDDVGALLSRKGLRYEVIDSLYSNTVQPGAVVAQVPEADMRVKEGRIVFLTINSFQQRQTTLPNVKDLSQRQAEALLTGAGLEVATVTFEVGEYKDLVKGVKHNGRVCSTGDRLPFGASVELQVSKGPESEELLPGTEEAIEMNKEWLE